jgi:glycogen operon protein
LDERRRKLLEFTCKLIEFRRAHPNLRRRKFFQDREVYHPSSKDIAWYRPDGLEMTQEEWNTGWMRSLAVMLNGKTLGEADDMGDVIEDDTLLVMLNSYGEAVTYTLPQSPGNRGWKLMMNTHDLNDPFGEKLLDGTLHVEGRSVAVLRELTPAETAGPHAEAVDEKEPETEPQPALSATPAEAAPMLQEPVSVE